MAATKSAPASRYAAFLRGVMPQNCKMPELRAAFEAAGFTDVKTVLGSGNVVFSATGAPSAATLEQRAEKAMQQRLGRVFPTIVRSIDELRAILATDPYGKLAPSGAKRVVTFLRGEPKPRPRLPLELDGAHIVALRGREAYTAYVRSAKGQPAFMTLIERTFGKEVTTRTWDTLAKVAR